MMQVVKRVLLALTIAVHVPLALADAGPQPQMSAAKTLISKPVSLRGTLGDASIQVNLRAKPEDDGVEGEYFYFGRSGNVLLAGEISGEDFLMEESENGTDVSGHWTGTLAGDTLSGEWESVDGKEKKPFSLRVIRAADNPRRAVSPATGTSTNKQR